mmetsp:Transcript_5442/g.13436  ORF Transcript_5442/g.13436 Transcript_5442/m.13436 type:complete len:281 (-) Transcript_5442:336-1178(-)
MSKRRPREEACYICGHYHDYEGGQACGICGHVMAPHEKKQQETVIPTNVIPGFLYLGSYDSASRSELLKAMGITHILNTVPTCQALFKNTFTYHTVSESPPDFKECFEFIESLSSNPNNKVLVYCMSGTSRSPTIVIGYLMKVRGWRLAESYKWVKGKRATVHINPADTKRLIDLEHSLHGGCSVPQGLDALDSTCGFFSSTMPAGPSGANQAPSLAAAPAQGTAPVFGGPAQWSMSANPVQPVVFGGSGGMPVFGDGQPITFGAAPTQQAAQGQGEMEM